MQTTRLERALSKSNFSTPPIWFMRQAGRYHAHYQNIRQRYSFDQICKTPEVAAEVAMGPVDEFKFDAAILFSDILFPLEALGFPLAYDPAPHLGFLLNSKDDLAKLDSSDNAKTKLDFQAQAVAATRARLGDDKALLGFIGGPWTLYCYATCGSHKDNLDSAVAGFADGRWQGFAERLLPILAHSMIQQAKSGASAVAIFDTCAGYVNAEVYAEQIVPTLTKLIREFKHTQPLVPVIYYSKNTDASHWRTLTNVGFDCLGIDWHADIKDVILEFADRWAIQGNFDPHLLLADTPTFQKHLETFLREVQTIPAEKRAGWICGLGHGVLPKTPEQHVHQFVDAARRIF